MMTGYQRIEVVSIERYSLKPEDGVEAQQTEQQPKQTLIPYYSMTDHQHKEHVQFPRMETDLGYFNFDHDHINLRSSLNTVQLFKLFD